MQLIVGLGNPGAEYARTRHNAGFLLVDAVAAAQRRAFKADRRFQCEVATIELDGRPLTLLKPLTFMNLSGASVAGFANYFKVPVVSILVVHDELDLPPGAVRMKHGGGHGGHNGLRDITAQIGTEFWRLRIGIGHPGVGHDVVNYVLGIPSAADRELISEAVARGIEVLPEIVAGKAPLVMNRLNRRAREPRPTSPEK
ncbi:MAG: aminoacyl-tRNA hydrolase [Gammaproteobacteria bacterium]|nr:aminoacyl-tRNA hydrolase [Gammaproteobacteria bacterium]